MMVHFQKQRSQKAAKDKRLQRNMAQRQWYARLTDEKRATLLERRRKTYTEKKKAKGDVNSVKDISEARSSSSTIIKRKRYDKNKEVVEPPLSKIRKKTHPQLFIPTITADHADVLMTAHEIQRNFTASAIDKCQLGSNFNTSYEVGASSHSFGYSQSMMESCLSTRGTKLDYATSNARARTSRLAACTSKGITIEEPRDSTTSGDGTQGLRQNDLLDRGKAQISFYSSFYTGST